MARPRGSTRRVATPKPISAGPGPETISLPSNFEITEEMNQVIDAVRARKHLFITGKAGSGKSTLLTYLRSNVFPEETVYCSFTGVAALNIGGETLHKFFGFLPDVTIEKVQGPDYHPRSQKTMKVLKTLVIDEVSMVRADLLDVIDCALRRYGPNYRKPFGGVQVVMFGDLYQLPPIVTNDEKEFFKEQYGSEFFFDSHVFEDADYEVIELTKVYRQKDQHLIEILDRIRTNTVSQAELEILNEQVDPDFEPDEDDDFYITLTSSKSLSAKINLEKLEALEGELFVSEASVSGYLNEKNFPTEKSLEFKIGSQVMLINNDQGQRWANGTLARIKGVNKNAKDEIQSVLVELASDRSEHLVEYNQWDLLKANYENSRLAYEVIASFIQLPFRLAWSVTIHKSQGKTFDRVIIDLTHKVFAPGQMYVALSRCRTLEGIKLRTPIQIDQIMTDERVVDYMKGR